MPSVVRTIFDAQSVAAGATANSVAADITDLGPDIRPVINSSGANITVTIQTSADGGTTWHSLASYAAGTTGAQSVIQLPGVLVRASATNAGAGAESVTVHLIVETVE